MGLGRKAHAQTYFRALFQPGKGSQWWSVYIQTLEQRRNGAQTHAQAKRQEEARMRAQAQHLWADETVVRTGTW